MKELGILFTSDMIRAILAGRKNQTRRIIKPQPDVDCRPSKIPQYMELEKHWGKWVTTTPDGETKLIKCRYGQPGDLLYCKETFIKGVEMEQGTYTLNNNGEYKPKIWFKANDPDLEWWDGISGFPRKTTPWKSPLFLRKEDARIWLRNTGVRVERLQDISEKDAVAEGIEYIVSQMLQGYKNYDKLPDYITASVVDSPRESFKSLIQSIHGPEIWDQNPWVFVINFEVLSINGRPKI